MWTKLHLVFAAISVAVFAANIQCQLQIPCDSPLRLRRPEFFKHCDCPYGDWSEWEVVADSLVDVPKSKCSTGQAYTETRQKVSYQENCPPQTQKKQICLPDVVDRLIIVLGLGSSGQIVKSISGPAPLPIAPFAPLPLPSYKKICSSDAGLVCSHIAEPHNKKKRSSEFPIPAEADSHGIESDSNPHPFNWQEHGKRLRREVSSSCSEDPDSPQHVLFLLDTSGSIGTKSFDKMKDALSRLTLLFCKPIQIAVMTFNHEYKLEFCFNCHDNTNSGRDAAAKAIKDIKYRSGWTHTGGAAKCACERVLHPSCGVPITADCINVVFITDGKSNDPTREICKEVKCMHDRLGVNTYAIGINNYNQQELDCIAKTSNLLSIFTFNSFDDFVYALTTLEEKLTEDILNGNYYACYDVQNGPT